MPVISTTDTRPTDNETCVACRASTTSAKPLVAGAAMSRLATHLHRATVPRGGRCWSSTRPPHGRSPLTRVRSPGGRSVGRAVRWLGLVLAGRTEHGQSAPCDLARSRRWRWPPKGIRPIVPWPPRASACTACKVVRMVGHERAPGLARGTSRSAPAVAPNRTVADHDAELEELAFDPLGTPAPRWA